MNRNDKDHLLLAVTLTLTVVVLLTAAALATSQIDGADEFIIKNKLILG